MPELPEVETIRRQLEVKTPFNIEKVSYSPVVSSILKKENKHFDPKGRTISHIKRHGKMLDFYLDDDLHILSHLGMSGSWRISPSKILEKHTHVLFEGTDKNGEKLYFGYVDPRRFGNMYYFFEEEADEYYQRLGVDIGGSDFTPSYVYQTLKKFPNKVLKPFLLDQAYFAGCGNYIASEICARAGIRPTRRCGKVSKKEAEKIVEATHSVLDQSLKNNGLTFAGGYTDAFGDPGEGVQNLVVFHQEICGLCKQTEVKKIVLAGRGTYYCPHCQR